MTTSTSVGQKCGSGKHPQNICSVRTESVGTVAFDAAVTYRGAERYKLKKDTDDTSMVLKDEVTPLPTRSPVKFEALSVAGIKC